VTGLFKESGIFNTTPGYEFLESIENKFGNKQKRKLGVGCVDAVTGSYIEFNETIDNVAKALLSSASIPFVFPYQEWPNGVKCVDGGTAWPIDVFSSIKRCRE